MSRLDTTIAHIKKLILVRDPTIRCVKYPRLLVHYLVELKNMIGNENVKDSIADMITYLIMEGQDRDKKEVMLNTALYGPPGIGKTSIGTHLARVWYALGALDSGVPERVSMRLTAPDGQDTFGYMDSIRKNTGMNSEDIIYLAIILYLVIVAIVTSLVNMLSAVGGRVGVGGLLLIGLIVIGLCFVLYLMLRGPVESPEVLVVEEVRVDGPEEEEETTPPVQTSTEGWDLGGEEIPDDKDIIVIVSREDFVAGYVGQTAIKSKALFAKHKGKAIFVDEAYTLINQKSNDPFGSEALDFINKVLGENPDSVVMILAGYKDKMQVLFQSQPGLERRCSFHFECHGYSPEELFRIFLKQLSVKGWTVEDKEGVLELFEERALSFPNYGGDTERLRYFTKAEYAKDLVAGMPLKPKTLKTEHVVKGIQVLEANQTPSEECCEEQDEWTDLMSRLKEPRGGCEPPPMPVAAGPSVGTKSNAVINTAPRVRTHH